ncbi:MAG: DUF1553 domain-containing protein [Planctomycetota bacterium]|nr:MAG: DUF1553 domain-containing protein [Planctomycetota bacterium]
MNFIEHASFASTALDRPATGWVKAMHRGVAAVLVGGWAAFAGLASPAQTPNAPEPAPEQVEWFEKNIRPILAENCYSCHSAAFDNRKGGLTVDSRSALIAGGDSGPAVVPGHPEESLLIEAVRRESYEMPPDKELSAREIQLLTEWVRRGAVWPDNPAPPDQGGDWVAERMRVHWAWHPPERPAVPEVPNDAWSRNAIDRFILARLREEGLEPAATADRFTLARRLHFDLIGLPPGPQEIADMMGSSGHRWEEAYRSMVDRLLESPQFGVRWGRHWLDLMRYAETLGHEFDYPIHYAWRYRDAVIDAFNADVPYDRFLTEHLAGDCLPDRRRHPTDGTDQSLALTGFWFLGDAVHAPVDILSDADTRMENQIDVFSKAFLGLTVACARCHDHKFDAIGTDDYYGLTGVLSSTRRVYALTDPHERIAEHNAALVQQLQDASAAALEMYRQAAMAVPPTVRSEPSPRVSAVDRLIGQTKSPAPRGVESVVSRPRLVAHQTPPVTNWYQWLQNVRRVWKELPAAQRQKQVSVSDPLFPLSVGLQEEGWQVELRRVQSRLQEAAQRFDQWERGTQLFADFRDGVPADWQLEAIDPTNRSQAPSFQWRHDPQGQVGIDWFSDEAPIPLRRGVFASHVLGRRQQVTLRSPNFQVSHPVVCIKMRGTAVHSGLVIDNYFMTEFHSLLFKDIRKSVDQHADAGWVTHRGDLNKYVGHSAYLSLEDSGDGWFEVQQVRFAQTPPPVEPSPAAMRLMGMAGESQEGTLERWAREIAAAFERVAQGTATDVDRLLVRGVLHTAQAVDVDWPVDIPDAAAQNGRAGDWAEARRRLLQSDQRSPSPVRLLAAAEGTPVDVPIRLRGDPHQFGDRVPRGCLAKLPVYRPAGPDSSGRRELAQSLTDPRHPLVARVMVNRVWHHLFGRGIVDSPDNLGELGGRPTHPQLLDYLATEFVAHDWSVKWLVREIVTSSTYRLGSAPSSHQREADPDHRLWSWRPVRRMTSESLRDALLATAGSLDLRLGGPSVPVHLTPRMSGRGRPKNSGPLDGDNRRTVYIEIRRNFLDPFQLVFDFPMPSTCVGRRNVSNVPAQALSMLNDPLVHEMVDRWVARTDAVPSPQARIALMIEQAFGRPADAWEIVQCQQMLRSASPESWRDLAHVLVNSKEFSFLR